MKSKMLVPITFLMIFLIIGYAFAAEKSKIGVPGEKTGAPPIKPEPTPEQTPIVGDAVTQYFIDKLGIPILTDDTNLKSALISMELVTKGAIMVFEDNPVIKDWQYVVIRESVGKDMYEVFVSSDVPGSLNEGHPSFQGLDCSDWPFADDATLTDIIDEGGTLDKVYVACGGLKDLDPEYVYKHTYVEGALKEIKGEIARKYPGWKEKFYAAYKKSKGIQEETKKKVEEIKTVKITLIPEVFIKGETEALKFEITPNYAIEAGFNILITKEPLTANIETTFARLYDQMAGLTGLKLLKSLKNKFLKDQKETQSLDKNTIEFLKTLPEGDYLVVAYDLKTKKLFGKGPLRIQEKRENRIKDLALCKDGNFVESLRISLEEPKDIRLCYKLLSEKPDEINKTFKYKKKIFVEDGGKLTPVFESLGWEIGKLGELSVFTFPPAKTAGGGFKAYSLSPGSYKVFMEVTFEGEKKASRYAGIEGKTPQTFDISFKVENILQALALIVQQFVTDVFK